MYHMRLLRSSWCVILLSPVSPLEFSLFSTVDQDEDKAMPSIAATMITELSEDSTEEAILMAKALPGSIYLGTVFRWIY